MAAKAKKDGESEAPEEAEAGAGKPKLPIKLIAIAVGALVVVGGGGFAAFKMLGSHKTEHAAADKHEPAPVKPVAFLDLPDILVNLSSSGGDRVQYLKVKIVLELPEQSLSAKIQPVLPRVMDAFQTYLRELRATDLDGSAGLYRLRDELTRRVNTTIAPNHINAVLFKEIVVQ
jgi:flagellar protein FliL